MINENRRPKLHMKESLLEVLFDLIAVSSIAIAFIYLIIMWNKIPNVVPTHFNVSGQVNGYGSKDSLFIMPIVAITIFIASNILAMFPHLFNYTIKITQENAKREYRNARLLLKVLMAEICILFSYIEWSSIKGAITSSAGLSAIFTPLYMLVIIGTLIFFIVRMNKLK